MKAITKLVLFVALVSLSACSVEVVDPPQPPTPDTPLIITDASYRSEFTAPVEGESRNVICNDRDTDFSYSFTYSGDLRSWESYFQGVESNEINGEVELNLESPGVSVEGNRVTVRYRLASESAPTLSAPGLDPQGIIVEPVVEGYTNLTIVVDDNGVERKIDTKDDPIPVLSVCEDPQPVVAEITESSYSSEFTTNSEPEGVICDDRATDVVVNFDYTGDLTSFNLRATGKRNGVEKVIATYTEDQIVNAGSFSGVVVFQENEAPRFTAGDELSTQGIVITPDIVGETTFSVQLNEEGDYVPLDFEIPIAAVCQD